jgi:AGCS family alanine or glycine:cation symporter
VVFISVALALFVFTSILYNYYLGENNLRYQAANRRWPILVYRGVVLLLILWGSVQNLGTVFAFADITMTLLALVNLVALALLGKVVLRLIDDYDQQRKAGVQIPVFDASQFRDLDLDPRAWPEGDQVAAEGGARRVCRTFFSACEIERRPRGASQHKAAPTSVSGQ